MANFYRLNYRFCPVRRTHNLFRALIFCFFAVSSLSVNAAYYFNFTPWGSEVSTRQPTIEGSCNEWASLNGFGIKRIDSYDGAYTCVSTDGRATAARRLGTPSPTCTPPAVLQSSTDTCVTPDLEEQACKDAAVTQNSTFSPGPITMSFIGDVASHLSCVSVSGMSPGRGCTAFFNLEIIHKATIKSPSISTGFAVMDNDSSAGCSLAVVAPTPSTPSTSVTQTLAPDQSCPAGQQRGSINGVSVCKPYGITTEVKTNDVKKDISTSPSGVTTTTEVSGSTTCKNGVCVTTNITTINGGGTTTGSVSQSQAGFCTANPKLKICSEAGGSVFGGSCAATFACSGDAIQCAIAKEIHSQNCLVNNPNDYSRLADQELVKTGKRTTELPGNSEVSISRSTFNQTNALMVGASCIADVPIVIFGRHGLLPFSKVCPGLEYLGMVLLAVSFVLAARIVTRG